MLVWLQSEVNSLIVLGFYSIAIDRLGQSQFLVKGVGLGLAAEEVGQGLHLVLAAALLEDAVAVSAAGGWVHRIVLEDSVEHVGRVYLGAAVG